MDTKKITFSFGENWKNYLENIDKNSVLSAKEDILKWLGIDKIEGKAVLDIGSGSGIHSLVFYLLGATMVTSVDYDIKSVEATKFLWKQYKEPKNWNVCQYSVLDKECLEKLPKADIVYSWGVLHHTGNMWDAIKNAMFLVKEGGYLWISIYQKGPKYSKHLQLKQKYNNASDFGKKLMIYQYIIKLMIYRIKKGENPFTWNQKIERGMNTYYDIIDWLGGLPYEVADKEEIVSFLGGNFNLINYSKRNEGGCSIYLFKKS